MIGSLLQYGEFFLRGLARPQVRRVLLQHWKGLPHGIPNDHDRALHALADHFCLAQDNGTDDGLGSYQVIKGWSASYPETTGYIIPTLLALAPRLQRPDLKDRAIRAGAWLLSIQRADGGWQGGRVDRPRPTIVFNTAQVIRGSVALAMSMNDDRYMEAAVRAADRIVAWQEADGSWREHNFLQRSRVYDSYVSAPLLRMAHITGNDAYRAAAVKNLEYVLSMQTRNGWFKDADNTIVHNDRPITHTIAYTLDGLLESYGSLRDERFLASALKSADVLLEIFMAEGRLHGRYDSSWKGSEHMITTGNAQLAIVWARSAKITGQRKYSDASKRMVEQLIAIQQTSDRGPAEARGAVSGSFPLWGRYEKFAYPNWAQKYFADAILAGEGIFTEP